MPTVRPMNRLRALRVLPVENELAALRCRSGFVPVIIEDIREAGLDGVPGQNFGHRGVGLHRLLQIL